MNKEKEICFIHLEPKQPARITSIVAGMKVTKRLADLGLTKNTQIELLRKIHPLGPVEIKVRGSNLILGRGIVSKILVTKI